MATTDTRKLGRRRPVAHAPGLRLARYLDLKALPPTPASVDYASQAAPALAQMYDNDRLGCCVVAAMAHIVGVFTGNAGNPPVIYTDQQIIDLYSAIGGYLPGDPSTDRGCNEVDALNFWQQHGAPAGQHQIAGWLKVDPTNVDEVKAAMWLFESLFFGIELPDSWIDAAQSSGFVWDAGDPDPSNGHAVCGVGFNDQGIQVCTWGMVGTLTWAALARDVIATSGGELYAVLSRDAIAKASQKAPNGLDFGQLVADFDAIGGTVAPSSVPTPALQPSTPAGAPTRDQVLAAVTNAVDALAWPK